MIDFFTATIAADPARAGRLGYYAVTIKNPGTGTVEADATTADVTAEAGEPGTVPEPDSSDEEGAA